MSLMIGGLQNLAIIEFKNQLNIRLSVICYRTTSICLIYLAFTVSLTDSASIFKLEIDNNEGNTKSTNPISYYIAMNQEAERTSSKFM